MNFPDIVTSFSILKEAKLRIKAQIVVSSIIISSGLVKPIPKFEDVQVAIDKAYPSKNSCGFIDNSIEA